MIKRWFHAWPLVTLLITLPLTESNARAQGVVRDSVGAVSSGRGGTNIAHFDNLGIILDNPAGLANIREFERLDFGLDFLVTDLDYTDRLNNANGEVLPLPLPQIAYARKFANERLTFGFGVFAPAGFGATYHLKHLLYGKREYTSLGALIKILPALAWKIDERLSVGGTFGLAISHVQLEMPFNLQTGLFAGLPTMLNLKATGFAPTWSLGLQYRLTPNTTFGLAYRGETRFRLKGEAKLDVSGVGFLPLRANYDAELDLVWPRSLGAGVSHRFNKKHRTSIDVIWFDWSHAFDKLSLKLTDGSNPLFRLALGPKVRDTIPLRWHDAVAFRIGHEFSPTDKDVFRVGYIFHETPIPSATLFPNLAGILRHVVSVGYGHTWDKWGLDLAYQYSWGPTMRVGRSALVGGDYNHSSVKAQAHWLMIGLTYSF
ncbi:MAG: outer membrane protein transport protein [Planctomycetes bacterium]|nr:outer membrane protein transport protein [Planctomycetota bacterium]